MGLTSEALWALSSREFDALTKQWQNARDTIQGVVAAIRADLHNTSSRQFKRHFEPADFMPDAPDTSLEARVHDLMAAGYSASQACALATSKQTREQSIHLIDSQMESHNRQARKPDGRRGPRKVG